LIISNIKFDLKKILLIEPYKLSYKTLDYYESIIVSIILDDERVLYGEITPLLGYTDETVEDVLKELKRVQTIIQGIEVQKTINLLYQEVNLCNSFALSAIIPPIEEYLGNYNFFEKVMIYKKDFIYALKSEQSIKDLRAEIEKLIKDGYKTVKIKVGKSLTKELLLLQYLASINLNGFAHWTRQQYIEEQEHALKLYDYVLNRAGKVSLLPIAKVKTEWNGVIDVFENILAHEQKITNDINKLVDIGYKESDHATVNLLQWFISEQVEEEANVSNILDQLKLIEGKGSGLFMLDREANNRTAG